MIPGNDSAERKRTYFPLLTPVIVVVIVAVVGIVVFGIVREMRSKVDRRLASSLQTVLDTTDKALRIWVEGTESDVSVLASLKDLRINVEKQLRFDGDARHLRTSSALRNIRDLFEPTMK